MNIVHEETPHKVLSNKAKTFILTCGQEDQEHENGQVLQIRHDRSLFPPSLTIKAAQCLCK